MFFNKNIEPCCAYCRKGERISETEVICLKKGVVSSGGFCCSFKYDPFKREPAASPAKPSGNFDPRDFQL